MIIKTKFQQVLIAVISLPFLIFLPQGWFEVAPHPEPEIIGAIPAPVVEGNNAIISIKLRDVSGIGSVIAKIGEKTVILLSQGNDLYQGTFYDLPDGEYTAQIFAKDRLGHELNIKDAFSFEIIDTQKPEIEDNGTYFNTFRIIPEDGPPGMSFQVLASIASKALLDKHGACRVKSIEQGSINKNEFFETDASSFEENCDRFLDKEYATVKISNIETGNLNVSIEHFIDKGGWSWLETYISNDNINFKKCSLINGISGDYKNFSQEFLKKYNPYQHAFECKNDIENSDTYIKILIRVAPGLKASLSSVKINIPFGTPIVTMQNLDPSHNAIILYDDSKHGDINAGDSIYGNILKSDTLSFNTYIAKLSMETKDAIITKKASFTVRENKCAELYPNLNNAKADRLNLIFVGGDQNIEPFVEYIKEFIDINGQKKGLFSLDPFNKSGNKNKFNFWYVNKRVKFDVSTKSFQQMTPEERNMVMTSLHALRDECILPNRYTYYFPALNQQINSGFGPDSEAMLFTGGKPIEDFLNNPEDLNIKGAIHESGHLIGHLWDEYFYGTDTWADTGASPLAEVTNIFIDKNDVVNEINTTIEACLKNTHWKKMLGNGCGQDGIVDCINGLELSSGPPICKPGINLSDCYNEVYCYEGATYEKNSFRPIYSGIMKNYGIENYSYGPIGAYYIQKQLDLYSGK